MGDVDDSCPGLRTLAQTTMVVVEVGVGCSVMGGVEEDTGEGTNQNRIQGR